MLRRLSTFLLATMSCAAFCQNLNAPGQYFQFRKMSGLSGSGFGVTINGQPDISGAMAFSTPIGYSLGGGIFELGVGVRSYNNSPQLINVNSHSQHPSSGTAQLMAGLGTNFGNFTYTFEVLSYERDSVDHLQWQLPIKSSKLGVSVGCQNLLNRPEGGTYSSRSFYAVGTYEYMPGDHVSVGYGDSRFHGPFANTDYLINQKFKATLEFDTFAFNPGLAYSFGKIKGLGDDFERNEVSLFAGYLNFHYATIAVSWAF